MSQSPESCPGPDALAGWLEGKLSPEGRRPLAAHLAACDDCRRAVALAATLGPVPEAALDENLLRRVVAASRRGPARRWAAAAAAVLGAAALLAWLARPRGQTEVVQAPKQAPAAVVDREPVQEETPRKVVTPAPVAGTPALPRRVVEPRDEPPAKRKAEPRPEVVKEEPEPAKRMEAPPKPEGPAPVAAPEGPGKTVPDLSGVFTAVFEVDPRGDLWLRRGRAEPARAGAFENVAPTDSFHARDGGAGFTLEVRATVVLEKGTEAAFCYFKPDKAYSVDLVRGLVMIDTQGLPQNWRASRGGAVLDFPSLNGRLALETSGEQISALLLEGRGDLKAGAKAEMMEAGREVVVSPEGKTSTRRAETRKKAQRFGELRPKLSTAFAATFDEEEAGRPFAYGIAAGRLVREGAGLHLQAVPTDRDPALLAAEVRAERPVPYVSGLLLRFRYRTTAPSLTVRLGKFSAPFASGVPGGRWADGEIPLAAFESEGVPIIPLEEAPGVRFEAASDGKTAGRLDVDGIQFYRRAR